MSLPPINALIVEIWFNGFYSALVFGTLWTIASNNRDKVMKKLAWVGLTLTMYISSTIHCSINWNLLANAVMDNADGDGPGLANSLTHIDPKVVITAATFLALNIVLADLLFVWRCWVVWERRWYLAAIPMCASIVGIVLAGLAIHAEVLLLEDNIAIDIIQKYSRTFVSLSNAFFTLSIATSMTTTILISLRILLVQASSKRAGLGGYSYRGVIEIIIESAALYSVTLLLFVIFESAKSPLLYFPQNIHAQVAGISPTLIILRVSAGRSKPDSHWTIKQSALQFAASSTLTQDEGERKPVYVA